MAMLPSSCGAGKSQGFACVIFLILVCWSRLRLSSMPEAHTPPIDVPFPWVHTIDLRLRNYVYWKLGCHITWRQRQQWGPGKKLVLNGPSARLDAAEYMVVRHMHGDNIFDGVDDMPPSIEAKRKQSCEQNLRLYPRGLDFDDERPRKARRQPSGARGSRCQPAPGYWDSEAWQQHAAWQQHQAWQQHEHARAAWADWHARNAQQQQQHQQQPPGTEQRPRQSLPLERAPAAVSPINVDSDADATPKASVAGAGKEAPAPAQPLTAPAAHGAAQPQIRLQRRMPPLPTDWPRQGTANPTAPSVDGAAQPATAPAADDTGKAAGVASTEDEDRRRVVRRRRRRKNKTAADADDADEGSSRVNVARPVSTQEKIEYGLKHIRDLQLYVRMVTFGASNLMHHGRQYAHTVQKSEWVATLESLTCFKPCCGVLVFDALCIDHLMNMEKHTGYHSGRLRLIVDDEKSFGVVCAALMELREFLLCLKREDTEDIPAQVAAAIIACVCNRGKHRSVAFMHLLKMVLDCLGVRVSTQHLSENVTGQRHAGWRNCWCDRCNPTIMDAGRKYADEKCWNAFKRILGDM